MSRRAMLLSALGAAAVILAAIGLLTGTDVLTVVGIAAALALLVVASVVRGKTPVGEPGGPPEHDVPVTGSEGDWKSTTGSGPSGTFVGRVAGEPDSAAGQSGAEARAESQRRREQSE
ncbi:hypothetical protein ACTG9Q_05805 [Actinokineospora sp. 24-640]